MITEYSEIKIQLEGIRLAFLYFFRVGQRENQSVISCCYKRDKSNRKFFALSSINIIIHQFNHSSTLSLIEIITHLHCHCTAEWAYL